MARGCRCGLGSVAARRMALSGTERLPGGPGGGPSRSTTRRPRTSGAHGLQVHDISTNRRTTATPTKVSVDNCSASWESLWTQPYLTALRTPRTPRLSPRDHEHVMSGSPTRLSKGLKQRHLTMIAIGGVIGAGLFVGSGVVIANTGPGSFLGYALTGVLIVLAMRMLGEMAAAHPSTGSFADYARRALGGWAAAISPNIRITSTMSTPVRAQCHVAKVDLAVCAGHRRGETRVTGRTGVISGRGCCCVAESGSGDSRDAGRLGSAGRGGRRDRRLRGAGTTVGRQAARARDHVPDVGVGVVPR